jgi:hypothetical protein
VTATVALLLYAGVLGSVGGVLLRRSSWTTRRPGLGVLVWQAAACSVLLATSLAGLTLLLPAGVFDHGLARLVDACVETVRSLYLGPEGGLALAFGGALAVGVPLWAGGNVTASLLTASWARRRQRRLVGLVARRDPRVRALVVDSATAAVYCVPGRRRSVVVTTAAVDALDAGELDAVLAHEAAHLRERHHVAIGVAEGLRRAFPFAPLMRQARAETARLVEMRADDVATRGRDRLTVASALVALAEGTSPLSSLSAGGEGAKGRVTRLLSDDLRPAGGVVPAGLIAGLLALPPALAVAPALVATVVDFCMPPV